VLLLNADVEEGYCKDREALAVVVFTVFFVDIEFFLQQNKCLRNKEKVCTNIANDPVSIIA